MPTPAPLGRWPNAPLAYVVTELQFQKVPSFDVSVEKVAEALIEDFPVRQEGVFEVVTMTVDGEGKPTRQSSGDVHDFRNFDATAGVRITSESVSMHSVAYADWPTYRRAWLRVVDTVASIFNPRVVLRTGLRYIDLIIPEDNKIAADYLAEGLRPWKNEIQKVGKLQQHNLSTRFKGDRISSKLIVLERVTAGIALPPSFQPMELKFSEIQQRALEFQRTRRGAIALLDIDAGIDGPRPTPSIEELSAEFEQLHAAESAIFRSAVSSHALASWKGNTR